MSPSPLPPCLLSPAPPAKMNSSDEEKQLQLITSLKEQGRRARGRRCGSRGLGRDTSERCRRCQPGPGDREADAVTPRLTRGEALAELHAPCRALGGGAGAFPCSGTGDRETGGQGHASGVHRVTARTPVHTGEASRAGSLGAVWQLS